MAGRGKRAGVAMGHHPGPLRNQLGAKLAHGTVRDQVLVENRLGLALEVLCFAAQPIAGAPRATMSRIACATSAAVRQVT